MFPGRLVRCGDGRHAQGLEESAGRAGPAQCRLRIRGRTDVVEPQQRSPDDRRGRHDLSGHARDHSTQAVVDRAHQQGVPGREDATTEHHVDRLAVHVQPAGGRLDQRDDLAGLARRRCREPPGRPPPRPRRAPGSARGTARATGHRGAWPRSAPGPMTARSGRAALCAVRSRRHGRPPPERPTTSPPATGTRRRPSRRRSARPTAKRTVRPSGSMPVQLMPAPQITAMPRGPLDAGAQQGEGVVDDLARPTPAVGVDRPLQPLLLHREVGVGQAGGDMRHDVPRHRSPVPRPSRPSRRVAPGRRPRPRRRRCGAGSRHRAQPRAPCRRRRRSPRRSCCCRRRWRARRSPAVRLRSRPREVLPVVGEQPVGEPVREVDLADQGVREQGLEDAFAPAVQRGVQGEVLVRRDGSDQARVQRVERRRPATGPRRRASTRPGPRSPRRPAGTAGCRCCGC